MVDFIITMTMMMMMGNIVSVIFSELHGFRIQDSNVGLGRAVHGKNVLWGK
jgi:hypothetical protein